ncbi:unnamed protein product [Rhizophagus irregularis]|nr:unnamed protein product [Rhizophagus irregularis]
MLLYKLLNNFDENVPTKIVGRRKLRTSKRPLYDDYDDYDVYIQIGEGNDLEIFKAHSDVLRGRSAYFDTALSPNWAKKEGNVFIFKKPNIRPDVFRIILLFIYNTIIDLDENAKDICELLIAADEINLNELIEYIHENITDLSYKNMISFFNALNNFTMYHQEIENIKEYVKKYIIKNAFRIFNNFDSLHSNYSLFLELENDCLLSLIQNDDFRMDEIEIWNNLIKWAIAKNPTVSSYIYIWNSKASTPIWNSKEIEIFKKTIQQFIPHIRFFQIPPDDYYDNVHPLSALLPEKLEKDINLYFIDPEIPISSKISQPRILIDSLIIKMDHIYQIAHWIDDKLGKKSHSLKNLQYDFNLLLRGSRDGFGLEPFKEKCYNKGATIVIIKLKDKDGRIIGGYNPLNWSGSDDYLSTYGSFIFSFQSIIDSSTTILSRIRNERSAIYDSKDDKLGFGRDLRIFNRTCVFTNYERKIITPRTFNVEDYEVFEVERI